MAKSFWMYGDMPHLVRLAAVSATSSRGARLNTGDDPAAAPPRSRRLLGASPWYDAAHARPRAISGNVGERRGARVQRDRLRR
jgi:hypothetical protein